MGAGGLAIQGEGRFRGRLRAEIELGDEPFLIA
jgi:hypothetical protein